MEEIWEVVGVRHLDFVGQDGRPVQCSQWFVTGHKDGVEGVITDKISLQRRSVEQLDYVPVLGDLVRCVYNKYGKVAAFIPVE